MLFFFKILKIGPFSNFFLQILVPKGFWHGGNSNPVNELVPPFCKGKMRKGSKNYICQLCGQFDKNAENINKKPGVGGDFTPSLIRVKRISYF